jgi:L-lactate dehydrogenase complex protein LldG
MSERDNILGRIREALKRPAPLPGDHGQNGRNGNAATETHGGDIHASIGKWLPPASDLLEQKVELFQKNSIDLKTDFRFFSSREELLSALAEIAQKEGWKKVGTHSGELANAAREKLGLDVVDTSEGYDVQELEKCDAGISECDALIAQTGTVVVTARSAGGRALSVLPPHHVVLARREQLLADLPAAFALLKRKYNEAFPSMMSFITGPSRTGDIERILVLGAHGPKKLTVLCY